MPRSSPAASAPFCTTSQKASPAEPWVITEKVRSPPSMPPPPPESFPPEAPPSVVQAARTSGAARASAARRMGRAIVHVLQASRGSAVPAGCPDRSCLPAPTSPSGPTGKHVTRTGGVRWPPTPPTYRGTCRGSAADQRRLEVVPRRAVDVPAELDRLTHVVEGGALHREHSRAGRLPQQAGLLRVCHRGADPLVGHPQVDTRRPEVLVEPALGEVLDRGREATGQVVRHQGQR